MYDIVRSIIGHVWQSGSTAAGDQQTLYYICGSLVILLTVVFIDLLYRFFRAVIGRGRN